MKWSSRRVLASIFERRWVGGRIAALTKREQQSVRALREELLQEAEAGDLTSLVSLGWIYHVGIGVRKNPREATRCYAAAVSGLRDRDVLRLGLSSAVLNLGTLRLKGPLSIRDERSGAALLARAAKLGEPLAQLHYGRCLLQGLGTSRNRKMAVMWLSKAALTSNRAAASQWVLQAEVVRKEAAVDLAWEFDYRKPRNARLAAYWYRKAARGGSVDAMVNLGVLYANGDGVRKSIPMALACYRRAAQRGNATAKANLAELRTLGRQT